MIKISPYSFPKYRLNAPKISKPHTNGAFSSFSSLGMNSKGMSVLSDIFEFIGKVVQKFGK